MNDLSLLGKIILFFSFSFSLLKVKTRSFSFLKRISKTVLKELISESGSILVDCGLRTRSKISSIEEMIVLPEILRFELSEKNHDQTKPISFLVEFFWFKEIFSQIFFSLDERHLADVFQNY